MRAVGAPEASRRRAGTIVAWVRAGGAGFIRPDERTSDANAENVFLPAIEVPDELLVGNEELGRHPDGRVVRNRGPISIEQAWAQRHLVGRRVSYTLVPGPNGSKAHAVQILPPPPNAAPA